VFRGSVRRFTKKMFKTIIHLGSKRRSAGSRDCAPLRGSCPCSWPVFGSLTRFSSSSAMPCPHCGSDFATRRAFLSHRQNTRCNQDSSQPAFSLALQSFGPRHNPSSVDLLAMRQVLSNSNSPLHHCKQRECRHGCKQRFIYGPR
jgi:hypothetical protein